MKRTGILLLLLTLFILFFYILFPKNLGKNSPVWELQERFFDEAYGGLRAEYFISMRMQKMWHEQDSIFYIWNDHDAFRMTEVYLKVDKKIADNCKIKTSGMIEWQRYDLHMLISADALTDAPICITKGFLEYNLEQTEESVRELEAAEEIDAQALLDTVLLIRREYREALYRISGAEYRKVCAGIKKAIIGLIAVWAIYLLTWGTVEMVKRNYQRKVDEAMKDFIE